MSYVIDIYRGDLQPTRNLIDFALFVAFFPQLVAGPIERARNLLPQVANPRTVTPQQRREGLWLIAWGFFEKVFVADNLAPIADAVFSQPGPRSGAVLLLGIYAFAFQIYGDFAGYSDIARGLSKLMGIELMINFRSPYLVTNPTDFWRHWHISLSTWLRDYVYIPLGGNRGTHLLLYRNLLVTMVVGGLWHGAAWNFVVWGTYHGLLLVLQRLLEPQLQRILPATGFSHPLWKIASALLTFHAVCFGWLIFRSPSLAQAWVLLCDIVFRFPTGLLLARYYALQIAFFTWVFVLMNVLVRAKTDWVAVLRWPPVSQSLVYLLVFYLLSMWGYFGAKEFIYFQF